MFLEKNQLKGKYAKIHKEIRWLLALTIIKINFAIFG
jgi:uncharacterized membrane protein YhdT